jgi:hypothetical protein
MMREILIYGLPQHETRPYCEELLSVKCQTREDIRLVKEAAALAGYHSFRVAYYNGEKPDFEKAVQL